MLNTRFRPILLLLGLMAGVGPASGQTIEDSVPVPGAWVGSLAYIPVQDEVWGQTWSGNSVFVISADSNRVVASIPLHWPFMLGYDSADNKVYASYQGVEQDSLAVIDCASYSVIKRMEMPGATMPVWDPVSDRVYVSCQSTNSVAVVDCRTDSLLTYIPVGACPIKMYVNTMRRKLYVLNYDAGSVSVINMLKNQVIKTIAVGQGNPNAGHYCRQVDKFYSDGSLGNVTVIDGATDSIVAHVPVAAHGNILSAAGNEQAALVMVGVYTGSCYVYTVDAVADTVTASLNIGGVPDALAYSQPTDRFYCGNGCFGSVSVMAGDGASILKTLPMGYSASVFTKVPRHNRIYVGDLGRSWVYVIRDSVTGVSEGAGTLARPLTGVTAIPNPFTHAVTISGYLGDCPARVYSPAGALVRVISPAWSGSQQVAVWDGLGNDGQPAPEGVYLVDVADQRCKIVKTR